MKRVCLQQDKPTSTLYYNLDSNWDDLRFPSTGLNPAGQVSPPGIDSEDGGLLFDDNSTEIIAGFGQMPHSWKMGSTIKPHVHWQATNDNAGDVLWRLDYKIANAESAFPADWVSDDLVVSSIEDEDFQMVRGFTPIDMSGKTLSCVIKFRVKRVGGDELDTLTGDAKLLEFDLHYEIDSVASGKEFTK